MKEKNRERQKSTVNDCRDTAGDAETCCNTPEFPPWDLLGTLLCSWFPDDTFEMCVKKKEHCHGTHCTNVQFTIEFQSKMIFRSHTSIYLLNFDSAQRIHALADLEGKCRRTWMMACHEDSELCFHVHPEAVSKTVGAAKVIRISGIG